MVSGHEKAKPKKLEGNFRLAGGVLLILFGCLFLIGFIIDFVSYQQYMRDGFVVDGIVTEKYSRSGVFNKEYYISYTFSYINSAGDLTTFSTKGVKVDKSFYDKATEGSGLKVRYLREEANPSEAVIDDLLRRPTLSRFRWISQWFIAGAILVIWGHFALKRKRMQGQRLLDEAHFMPAPNE